MNPDRVVEGVAGCDVVLDLGRDAELGQPVGGSAEGGGVFASVTRSTPISAASGAPKMIDERLWESKARRGGTAQ